MRTYYRQSHSRQAADPTIHSILRVAVLLDTEKRRFLKPVVVVLDLVVVVLVGGAAGVVLVVVGGGRVVVVVAVQAPVDVVQLGAVQQ